MHMAEDALTSRRFTMVMPKPLRDELERAAAAVDRPAGYLARQLIAKGLNDPLNGAEKATFGSDATRSAVTGIPYETGSGAHPPEVQDRLAMAAAGGRLSEMEAQRIVRGDSLENSVADAAASIEDLVK
jgi:hypothetical protein